MGALEDKSDPLIERNRLGGIFDPKDRHHLVTHWPEPIRLSPPARVAAATVAARVMGSPV